MNDVSHDVGRVPAASVNGIMDQGIIPNVILNNNADQILLPIFLGQDFLSSRVNLSTWRGLVQNQHKDDRPNTKQNYHIEVTHRRSL